MASTLGAKKIKQIASAIEVIDVEEREYLLTLIHLLETAFKEFAEVLSDQDQTETTAEVEKGKTTDDKEIAQYIEQLDQLLELADTSALELSYPLREAAENHALKQEIQALCDAINEFDFELASEMHAQLKPQLLNLSDSQISETSNA